MIAIIVIMAIAAGIDLASDFATGEFLAVDIYVGLARLHRANYFIEFTWLYSLAGRRAR